LKQRMVAQALQDRSWVADIKGTLTIEVLFFFWERDNWSIVGILATGHSRSAPMETCTIGLLL